MTTELQGAVLALLAGVLLLCAGAAARSGLIDDTAERLFDASAARWHDHQRVIRELVDRHGFDPADARHTAGTGWGRWNLFVLYAQLRVATILHRVGSL